MTALSTQMPRWTGKALGAAAALIFAPAVPAALVWWLVAGIALGHLVDALLPRTSGRPAAKSGAAATDAADAAMRYAFAALGNVAAASGAGPAHGRSPEAEPSSAIHIAERLMSRLAFDAGRRQEALVWFHAGRDQSFPFDAVAAAARHEFAAHPTLLELTIDAMSRMSALADSPAATGALLDLGERIGADRERLALRAVAAAALMPERQAEQRARDILGVLPDDSEKVIRLAYRRRVARWHPDRLGPQATDAELALAQRRMWKLREALETLLDAGP